MLAESTGVIDKEYLRHLASGVTTSSNVAGHQADAAPTYPSTCSRDGRSMAQPDSSGTAGTASPILELVLQGKPVAVALKQHSHPTLCQAHTPRECSSQTNSQHQANTRQHDCAEQPAAAGAKCDGKSAEPWTCIYAMDGSVLATEQEGNIYKGSATAPHTHTILTGQTPLVRHLHIVFNAQGTCPGCRCTLHSGAVTMQAMWDEAHHQLAVCVCHMHAVTAVVWSSNGPKSHVADYIDLLVCRWEGAIHMQMQAGLVAAQQHMALPAKEPRPCQWWLVL